jgi:hypothetical protein
VSGKVADQLLRAIQLTTAQSTTNAGFFISLPWFAPAGTRYNQL